MFSKRFFIVVAVCALSCNVSFAHAIQSQQNAQQKQRNYTEMAIALSEFCAGAGIAALGVVAARDILNLPTQVEDIDWGIFPEDYVKYFILKAYVGNVTLALGGLVAGALLMHHAVHKFKRGWRIEPEQVQKPISSLARCKQLLTPHGLVSAGLSVCSLCAQTAQHIIKHVAA